MAMSEEDRKIRESQVAWLKKHKAKKLQQQSPKKDKKSLSQRWRPL